MNPICLSIKQEETGKRIKQLLQDHGYKVKDIQGAMGFETSGEGYFRLTAFGTYENTVKAIDRIKKL